MQIIENDFQLNPLVSSIQEAKFFKKKVLTGVIALGARHLITQLIQTSANIILARILFPKDFGVFAIILFLINMFTLLPDLGLNASIIQRNKQPSLSELRAIFTIQICLGLLSVLLMILVAPLFLQLYKNQLRPQDYSLLLLSALAPLFYNLRIIPHSLLERSISYKRLVAGEVFETAIQQLITVSLALTGLGVSSFVIGLVISRFFSAILFFILKPWRIGFDFSFHLPKSYLTFGLPYQINGIVGLINGSLAPIVVGGLAGTTALGLVNWAGGIGALPLAIGQVVGRVVFPVGARVQDDKKMLKSTLERAIQLISITAFPVIAVMIALAQPITYIIFTNKWIDGIPSLYIFTLQSLFLILASVLTNGLLALGKASTVRNFTLFVVILHWFLAIPLVKILGFNGFSLAGLLSSIVLIYFFKELKKQISINLLQFITPYLIYSVSTGIVLYIFTSVYLIHSLLELLLSAIFGFLFYG
ncbi:oligosaccharide flippase family protein, partial [Candidatus Daviesbacteria bacterium]|nr:oligosaccharide flippase family protein [Candidatus Daviesbacteria bacterium]